MSNTIPLPPLPFGWWKDKVTESEMEHFIHTHAAAVSAAKDARIKVLEDALRAICSEQDARQGYASVETYDAARAALGDKTHNVAGKRLDPAATELTRRAGAACRGFPVERMVGRLVDNCEGLSMQLLNELITAAAQLAGGDAVSHGARMWQSEGGRACPIGWEDCSQPVYVDLKTGAYDYGQPGGPGHADCKQNCSHGMQPAPEDDDPWLSGDDMMGASG